MQIKIKDFVDILIGYNFRSAIKEDSGGDLFVLQANNIKNYEYLSSIDGFAKIYSSNFRNPPKIRYNDIVIASRGNGYGTFKSTVFKFTADNIIASSSVLIIRIKSDIILPEYLSLYLNSENGQKELFQITTGSSLKILNQGDLGNLAISVPSFSEQKSIVDLSDNIMQQENIMRKAAEIKKRIMNGIFGHFSNL